jgi:hypothetical protein
MGEGDSTRWEPAWTWAHYKKATDTFERDDKCFANQAARVKAELWVSLSFIHCSIHRIHQHFCNIDCRSIVGLYAGLL